MWHALGTLPRSLLRRLWQILAYFAKCTYVDRDDGYC